MWEHLRPIGHKFKCGMSTAVTPLGKELIHNCFSQLRSRNEYTYFSLGVERSLASAKSTMQHMGTCGREVQSQSYAKMSVWMLWLSAKGCVSVVGNSE